MRFFTAPDALFSLVGLRKLTTEEMDFVLEAQRTTNAVTLRPVAAIVVALMLLQVVLILFEPKVLPGSPLQIAYLTLFTVGAGVSLFFFVVWTQWPRRQGYRFYARSILLVGIGLTLCDLQLSGDFSTYTLVLMGTALLYSTRLPWYLVDFCLSWFLLLAGMALFPPVVLGTNPAAATVVLTVVSIAAGILLEARRIGTQLLTIELDRRNEELKEYSFRDALTGLYNRRFLFEWLEKQMPLARRNGSPLTVALIDLDHFKAVNDTAGHEVGDQVLKQTARWIEDALRKSDLVARYGGEEFVVALPGTAIEQARLVVERSLETFRHGLVPGWSRVVTFSAGLTTLTPDETVQALFQRADKLMYQAKAAGRNRICEG